ncbi:MAG TPA: hypothetical protein VD790_08720 [Thermoleophilaceae bacterium]|nr:hypothetical protein [Thermoleophilaceae bacterium]
MDSSLFVRAALIQGLLVAALFGILIALPLGDDFFDDWGMVSGPIAWILCALVASTLLPLPRSLVLFAALAGGVAGALVGIVASHTAGLVVAIAVFAASCAGYTEEDAPAAAE